MGITGTSWQQRNSVLCKTRIWPTFVFYKIQRQRHWQKTTQLSPKGNWKLVLRQIRCTLKGKIPVQIIEYLPIIYPKRI